MLTKFDLDDAGNSISALLGEVYPLRLGYTAVVCRTAKVLREKTAVLLQPVILEK